MNNERSGAIHTNDREGICPVCGGQITYSGASEMDDHGVTYPWECFGCGATGKEGFNLQFDCHYDVRDEDGNFIPGSQE